MCPSVAPFWTAARTKRRRPPIWTTPCARPLRPERPFETSQGALSPRSQKRTRDQGSLPKLVGPHRGRALRHLTSSEGKGTHLRRGRRHADKCIPIHLLHQRRALRTRSLPSARERLWTQKAGAPTEAGHLNEGRRKPATEFEEGTLLRNTVARPRRSPLFAPSGEAPHEPEFRHPLPQATDEPRVRQHRHRCCAH